jgi:hypothetical protein
MSLRKTLYTVCVNNYAPEITGYTFPLFKHYARKIGAEFHVITERKFPGYPPPYEKLQIHTLAKERGDDWAMFIDADALIHPECIDFTDFVSRDTVIHNGIDPSALRWRADNYFRRHAQWVGSCNWLAIASNWCLDLWTPLEISKEEAVANIFPTNDENHSGVIEPEHLLDDYTLSRNIAKFGLKVTTVPEVNKLARLKDAQFFWHVYTVPVAKKVEMIREVLFGKRTKDDDKLAQVQQMIEQPGFTVQQRLEAIKKLMNTMIFWDIPKSLFRKDAA